jgi:hypothetical protein
MECWSGCVPRLDWLARGWPQHVGESEAGAAVRRRQGLAEDLCLEVPTAWLTASTVPTGRAATARQSLGLGLAIVKGVVCSRPRQASTATHWPCARRRRQTRLPVPDAPWPSKWNTPAKGSFGGLANGRKEGAPITWGTSSSQSAITFVSSLRCTHRGW